MHMQLYPGWTARDNYAKHKKKRRKRDKVRADNNGSEGTIRPSVQRVCAFLHFRNGAPHLLHFSSLNMALSRLLCSAVCVCDFFSPKILP